MERPPCPLVQSKCFHGESLINPNCSSARSISYFTVIDQIQGKWSYMYIWPYTLQWFSIIINGSKINIHWEIQSKLTVICASQYRSVSNTSDLPFESCQTWHLSPCQQNILWLCSLNGKLSLRSFQLKHCLNQPGKNPILSNNKI